MATADADDESLYLTSTGNTESIEIETNKVRNKIRSVYLRIFKIYRYSVSFIPARQLATCTGTLSERGISTGH